MDLASFMGFAREWYQFQEIATLTFPLHLYAQSRSQAHTSQWILPHNLRMNLQGRHSHTNYIDP